MHGYLVTFRGLRKKPHTTRVEARSRWHAMRIVRSDFVVLEFLGCAKVKTGRPLTPLQEAVKRFLRNPGGFWAFNRLKNAFEKDTQP